MKNILFLFASLCLSLSVHAGDSGKSKVSEIAIMGKPIKVSASNKEMSPKLFIHDFLISANSDRCCYISKLKPSSWDKPELLLQNGGDRNEFDNVCVGKGIDNSLLVLENPTIGNKFLSMTVIPDTKSIASMKDVTQWKKYSLTETVPVIYGDRNFITLSDSTILIIGTPYSDLNHLFSVLNFKKPSVSPLTYFPQDGVKASKLSKFDVYAIGSCIFGNNKGRYFYQCESSKFAFIFSIENNEVKIIKNLYSEYPDYKDAQSRIKLKVKGGNPLSLSSDVNTEGIYILQTNHNRKGELLKDRNVDEFYGNTIEKYDWDGNLKQIIYLDNFGQKIKLSEDGQTIYLFSNDHIAGYLSQKVWSYDLTKGENIWKYNKEENFAFLQFQKDSLPKLASLKDSLVLCYGKIANKKITKEEKFDVAMAGRRYLRRIETMSDERNRLMLKFMEGRKISSEWLAQLSDIALSVSELRHPEELEQARKLYDKIPKIYLGLDISKLIKKYLYPDKIVKSGDKMADFKAYDYDGNLHYLSELRGKVIILEFGSLGCGACIQQKPALEKLYAKFKDEIEMITLSQDPEFIWKKKQMGVVSWKEWNERDPKFHIRRKYAVKGMPTFVVINPLGLVLTECYSAEDLEKILEHLFLFQDK